MPKPKELTYGDVRALIDAEKLGWQPRVDVPDYVRLPRFSLGASAEGLTPTKKVPGFKLDTLGVSSNPFLAVRRAERGLVTADAVREVHSPTLLRRLGLDDAVEKGVSPLPPNAGTPPVRSTGETGGVRTGLPVRETRTRAMPAGPFPEPHWLKPWCVSNTPRGPACPKEMCIAE